MGQNQNQPHDAEKDKRAPGAKDGHENEGEGSRSAARDYNERTDKFIKSGKVEKSAKEAERAIEGEEAEKLSEAEKMGRSHAKH